MKMKYAILDSGGKQYVAREGETIEVDRLPLEVGKPVEFKDILLVADNGKVAVGTPILKGATVKGRVLDHIKAAKIIVFKYVPKQRYRRKQGHRQIYTRVVIDTIALTSPASKKAEPKADEVKVTTTKPKAKAPEKTVKSELKSEAKKPTTKKSSEKKASTAKSATKKTEKSTTTKKTTSKSTTAKKSTSKSTKAAPKKSTSSSTKKSSPKKSSTTKK
jgi:large subunit ribosomal protein L21